MGSPLWRHHDTADLLDLRVVWGTHSVQVTGDLEVNKKHRQSLKRVQLLHYRLSVTIVELCVPLTRQLSRDEQK